MQNFERNPTVGSKVMVILTCYSSLADKTSSPPRSDSITTPRKMAYENSCKNLGAIKQSDRKL